MVMLTLASYRPDMARYNTNVLPTVRNVVPAPDGWKPLKAIVPTPPIYQYITYDNGDRITYDNGDPIVITVDWTGITGLVQLPVACTGLFAAKKKDGTEVMFAGTATTLYKLDSVTLTWLDVSSTTYASAVRWSFVQFGTVVYVQNGFNTEQKFDVETDSAFSDNATAPICKYLVVIQNFLFRFNIVSWAAESITNQPAMFMCSAIEDPTDNVPQNYNFCDFQTLPTGNEIMGAVAISGGAHIWLKNALYGMTITLSDVTFTTAPLDEKRGTSAPYSIGVIGTDHYLVYLDDGFWLFKGGAFSPVGDGKVNDTFLADCDQDERDDILACIDPENMVVWLAYTDTSATRKMIGYHYVLGEFTASDIVLTASTTARTFVYSTSTPPILIGNLLRFAIVDENGQLGYLIGDPAEAEFGTNEEAHNGVNKAVVNELRLITDATTYSAVVTTRETLGGTPRSRSASTPSSRTGRVPIPGGTAQGMTHQYNFTIAAGVTWTTATAVDVPARPGANS